MTDKKNVRLNKLVKEFNVSIDRIFMFLEKRGVKDLKPNSKVSYEVYLELLGEFDSQKKAKLSADLLAKEKELEKAEEIIKLNETKEEAKKIEEKKVIDNKEISINLKEIDKSSNIKENASNPVDLTKNESKEIIRGSAEKIRGVKVTGQKIDLTQFKEETKTEKKKRTRIIKTKVDTKKFSKRKRVKKESIEISAEEAQKRVRETLAKLQGVGKKSSVKNRKEKRQAHKEVINEENQQKQAENKIIKIAEFATASELASMMDVSVNDIVTTCMGLGMMISMNQRIDAETIQMLA